MRAVVNSPRKRVLKHRQDILNKKYNRESMRKGRLLIIDDEEDLRQLLARLLELENYHVWQATRLSEGLKIIEQEDIQVVICDVNLPDGNGLEKLPEIKKRFPIVEVVMLTAFGSISDGVTAIKLGAFDYITKGDEDNQLITTVERAIEKQKMAARLFRLQQELKTQYGFDNLIGSSAALKAAVELARKVSQTDTPVLLTGETGTGKEVFAQAIHYSGKRSQNPFVAVNCSAFAKDLLESEMFGYKAGAFTGANKNKKGLFEEAHCGTLFLDEIGEMDINLQAKLLRVLETQTFIKPGDTKPTKVDVRVIAATNRDLEEEIRKGNFREDLYYRIGVFKIEIPALRERPEDIPLLAEHFVKFFASRMNRKIEKIDPEFINRLKKYSFPGNIRELKNIIERSVILTDSNVLEADVLPKEFRNGNSNANILQNTLETTRPNLSLAEMEKHHIKRVLDFCEGNKTKAAEILGIGVATLYRKIETYQLD
jgi:DNA-binding NtrC family response regulator